MPEYLHPGVYVQEESSGAKPIEAASTSTACFVGTAPRGQPNRPTFVSSWLQYERAFGGLDKAHKMPLGVYHFFQNGGKRAYIVRVLSADPTKAKVASTNTVDIPELTAKVTAEAQGGGDWGNLLRVRVRLNQFSRNADEVSKPGQPPPRPFSYDFRVEMESKPNANDWEVVEEFSGLGLTEDGDKFYFAQINRDSQYIRIRPTRAAPDAPGVIPVLKDGATSSKASDDPIPWDGNPNATPPKPPVAGFPLAGGADGTVADHDYEVSLSSLDKLDDASILVIPGASDTIAMAGASYVEAQRPLGDMIYIVDSPDPGELSEADQIIKVKEFVKKFSPKSSYAALYFPWVRVASPYSQVSGAELVVPPSGMVAGLYARTDNTRGVWKAPAGTEATLAGAVGVAAQITDGDQDALNPIGVNCVRSFAASGIVVWGSRTLSTQSNPEYRYVPVRRTAMFLKTSLYRGTQWVVFEPNDEPLWSSVRFNLNAFLLTLFRAGAFQGGKPGDAYLVKCDADNNIQATIDAGQVHILVAFAPLKPAEFVIIHLQQLRKQ